MQLYKRNNVMKTSLIRQPFFYKKKVGFFFLLYTCCQNFIWSFSPFSISKYNSTLTPDEQARFDRFQIVAFFQNRPTVCRSSGDHRLTLYRWEKSWKKEDRSTKLFNLVVSTKKSSADQSLIQIGGDIGRQSTVSLQKTLLLILLTENRATVGLGKCN